MLYNLCRSLAPLYLNLVTGEFAYTGHFAYDTRDTSRYILLHVSWEMWQCHDVDFFSAKKCNLPQRAKVEKLKNACVKFRDARVENHVTLNSPVSTIREHACSLQFCRAFVRSDGQVGQQGKILLRVFSRMPVMPVDLRDNSVIHAVIPTCLKQRMPRI